MTSVMAKEEPRTLTPVEEKKYMTRLAKAKTGLILEHPFIGTVALNMPFLLDFSIKTAATNGKNVKFNPDFMDTLNDEELKFLVAHECMHPMLEHNYRRNSRQARRWNKAADYVINKLLVDESIGKMPKVGLYSDDIYKAGNGTSDGIYNILEDDGDGDEYGGDGDPLDDCQDGDGTPAEQAQEQAEWKVRVAQAAQSAKMMGKLSANMERVVGEILQPKVDWRDVLQRFLVKCRTDNRSFARFNRRFLPQGLFLPSVSGEVMGEILVAVDCSGSIDAKTIAQFAGEIQAIKDDMTPTKVHVVYFDSTVSHYEVYEHDDTLDIKPHGGGGTDFAPVFDYMVEHGIEPVAVVFLTDLCCNSFGIPPDCPVLWVSTEQDMSAPFGEIVEMN